MEFGEVGRIAFQSGRQIQLYEDEFGKIPPQLRLAFIGGLWYHVTVVVFLRWASSQIFLSGERSESTESSDFLSVNCVEALRESMSKCFVSTVCFVSVQFCMGAVV